MAAKLQNSNSLIKWGYRAILASSGDGVFINTTIFNYLWNQTSPIIKSARKIVPFMVPLENIGALSVVQYNKQLFTYMKIRISRTGFCSFRKSDDFRLAVQTSSEMLHSMPRGGYYGK